MRNETGGRNGTPIFLNKLMTLNYTFTNEDSYTEQNILKWRARHVLAIAGSGARVTPLFAKFPRKLTCVDASKPQLFLTEMRIEALKQFTHSEYCKLLGYKNASAEQRKALFKKLKLSVDPRTFLFSYYESINWSGILFTGSWERNFSNSVRLFQLFFPSLSKLVRTCETLEQQRRVYAQFKNTIWVLKYLLLIGTMMTVLTQKITRKKTHLTFLSPFIFSRMFEHSLKYAFNHFLVKNSFYYSTLITGQYASGLAPTSEIDEKQYIKLQAGAQQCEVKYINCDIVKHCQEVTKEYDFLSLSNVPDYIKNSSSLSFLHSIQTAFIEQAILVFRRSITSHKKVTYRQFNQITDKYKNEINQDTTPFYQIFIYQKCE